MPTVEKDRVDNHTVNVKSLDNISTQVKSPPYKERSESWGETNGSKDATQGAAQTQKIGAS